MVVLFPMNTTPDYKKLYSQVASELEKARIEILRLRFSRKIFRFQSIKEYISRPENIYKISAVLTLIVVAIDLVDRVEKFYHAKKTE